jgi:hypothetical protein
MVSDPDGRVSVVHVIPPFVVDTTVPLDPEPPYP